MWKKNYYTNMKSVVRLYRTVLLTWLKYDNISVLCSQAVHHAVRRDNRTSVEKRGNGMGTLMELKTRKHEYKIPGVWASMLKKTAIKKGQSRGTSNIGHSRHRTKKKNKNKTKIKTRTQKTKKMRKTDPIKIPGVNTCAGEE